MSDLIRRQDAIDAIKTAEVNFTVRSDINFADYQKAVQDIFNNVLYAQEQVLKRLPSAQRTGEWIQKPNIYGVAYCSECDYELHTNDTNFCPNCGADMRGENNETD